MTKWYRHRIVKHLVLPNLPNAPHYHPGKEIAKEKLRQQAEVEMSLYLRSHHPGQVLMTEFVKPRPNGIEVFVALTLYGPPSIEDEIIIELAEKGEV